MADTTAMVWSVILYKDDLTFIETDAAFPAALLLHNNSSTWYDKHDFTHRDVLTVPSRVGGGGWGAEEEENPLLTCEYSIKAVYIYT